MNHKNLSLIASVLMLFGAVIFLTLAVQPHIALAEPSPTGATIASDYQDYAPGATVTLTGAGWHPGEVVHIFVNDEAGKSWSHNSDPDPVADSGGGFTYQFQLPTWFIANYTVTATGPISGTATTTFTDLSIGTYDQCSNDDGDGYATGDAGCRWTNGNLQRNNSVYSEGDASVQRVWFTNLAPNSTHTITFKYGTTKDGKHAYDFLTTWDWSESWITDADRCEGIAGCETASESTLDIPSDPNVSDMFEPGAPGDRQFVMRGGVLNSATTPLIVSGNYNGTSETVITVDFTVDPRTGAMCSPIEDTCDVAIWFGAHVATQANWGLGMGAGNIPGSSYHVALDAIDGQAIGQRDNSMQANVVTFIPNGTIVIAKDALPDDAQDFGFNLNNNSTISQTIWLDDDGDPTLPNNLTISAPPGVWYASEITFTSGWPLTNLVCTDPTNNTTVDLATATSTIHLASNETVTCTYTDTKLATAQVKKVTIPAGSEAGWIFDLKDSSGNVLDTKTTTGSDFIAFAPYLVAGNYTIEEHTQTGWTSDGGVGCAFTVAYPADAGQIYSCTFTNTRTYNKDLTVTKTATASLSRTYEWLIEKSVDDAQIEIAEGGTAKFNYSVVVTPESFTDSDWEVTGTITVNNPNAFDVLGVNVTDAIDNGGVCTVTGGTDVTVPANGNVVLDYSCIYAAAPTSAAGTNTATATWDQATYDTPNGSASGTAGVDFSIVTPSGTNQTVTVIDDKTDPSYPVTLGTWNWEDGKHTFSYSLEKQGVAGTCTDYTNTAIIVETDQSDAQTVTVCVGMDLTITKTAAGIYNRTYSWMIDKDVDDTRIEIAEGGVATFQYTVEVEQTGISDAGWMLSGTITVTNLNDWEDIELTSLTDVVDNGGICILDGGPYMVPRSGSLDVNYSCTYASPPSSYSGTNTATATWDDAAASTPAGSAAGSAPFTLNQVGLTNKTVHVTDTYHGDLGTVTGTDQAPFARGTFIYARTESGVAGTCTNYANTATITETSQSADRTVTVCVGKDLTVTKTAAGTFDRTYKWLIDKSVDDTRIDIAQGGTATFNYSVMVAPDDFTDSGWALDGTITVSNPNNWEDITADVTDVYDGGGTCIVTGGEAVIIPAGKSITLNYSCVFTSQPTYAGKNTATVTWDQAASFTPNSTASGAVDVTLILESETNRTITVMDDKTDPLNPVTLGTSDYYAGPFEFTYSLEKRGVAGTCTDYTNIAVIDEINQNDSQTVTVCVGLDLTVTKTASGTFDRTYLWDITKSVDMQQINIPNGSTATFNYGVTVFQTGFVDSGWTLGGTIKVTNPNNWEDIVVDVTDVVDNGGTCTVTDGVGVTILRSSFKEFAYICTYASKLAYAGTNTATATWDMAAAFTPNSSASGSAGFTLTQLGSTNKTVTVTDSLGGNLGTVTATDGEPYASEIFNYEKDYQGEPGTCTNYDNTASIFETRDSASTNVKVCVGLDLAVEKSAAPSFTRTWDWTITKDSGATYNLFAGQSVTHDYKVTVTPAFTDSLWKVVGVITITNPNDWEAVTADVSDAVDNGGNCVVDADEVTVPANSSVVVGYTCTWASAPTTYTGTNTATVIWDEAAYFSPSGTTADTIAFEFTDPAEINPVITVDDNNLTDEEWSADRAYAEWIYTKDFACSSNPDDYVSDGNFDYSLTNTATINETSGDSATATVTINCYAPVVSKTAAGSYNERHEWDVEKTVTPVTQDAFAGSSLSYEWKVVVTEQTFEENFLVAGEISAVNPAPLAMTVDLVDTLDIGTVATITADEDCDYVDGKLTIPANTTATCAYTASLDGRTSDVNTVSAALNGIAFTASDPIEWIVTVIHGSATVTDDQIGLHVTITDGATFTGSEQYNCSNASGDYASDGVYTFSEDNTAVVTSNGAEQDRDSATATVNCFGPVMSKTAAGTYDERHEWDVEKTVSPTSQSGFAGDMLPFTWTITVTESVFEENFAVDGSITVQNPAPMMMTVALADALDTGTLATIMADADCDYANGILTIPANSTATCGYTAVPGGRNSAQNNVTATLNEIAFTASDPVEWTATVIHGEAVLTDDQGQLSKIITEGGTWPIEDSFTCSTDTTKYTTNYSYTETIFNTAVLTSDEEDQDSDTTSTAIACFIPEISKTAAGAYAERHEWDVTKTVSPESQNAFAGDSVSYEWTVVVTEQTFEENFIASGAITIVNHNSEDALTVALSDVLNDGTVATISACSGDADLSDGLTIAKASKAGPGISVCDYSAALDYHDVIKAPTNNTATALLNGISYSASDPVEWTPNVARGEVTLDDDQNPAFPVDITDGGIWNYSEQYICPDDPATYTGDGIAPVHTDSNTASVSSNGAEEDRDSATATVNCYGPVVSKTAAGTYNERHEWDVTKTADPVSQSAFAGDTVPFTWTIEVTESVFEENFNVSGSITVDNPAPMEMTIALTDVLSDLTNAVIGTCTDAATYAYGNLTIPADTATVCSYTANDLAYSDHATAPTANTATATLNGIAFVATDPIEWDVHVIRGEAVLTDDQGSLSEIITDGGTWPIEDSFTCSTDTIQYTTNFSYLETVSNTAVITSENVEEDRDNASIVVACYWPQIELTKTGNTLSKIGDQVSYDITLSNTTPSEVVLRALSCTISDPIIGFNKTVELASGATDENLDIAFTIPADASDPFVNSASATCSPLASTFSVSDRASWSTNLFQPKVEILKTGPEYAYYGQEVTYTFTINNLSSADSPNLVYGMNGYVNDDVLGNLTAAATTANCNNLAPGAYCTFDVPFEIPDHGSSPQPITNVVSVLYHPAGFLNDITAMDGHTMTVLPPSQVTDSSLCIFDRDPARDGQQFRSLFTNDPLAWPTYKMTATNPGQFYYNVFGVGAPGETLTFTVTLPYPFVTQGANPLHGYASYSTYTNDQGQTCFMPSNEFFVGSQQVILTNYTNGQYENLPGDVYDDGGPVDIGGDSVGTYSFEVTVSVPASGFVYLNLHLDYGLKGSIGYGKDGNNNAILFGTGTDPETNPFVYLVPQLADHNFLVSINSIQNHTAMVENWNEFKKNPGVGGLSRWKNDNRDPVVGASITLKKGSTVIGTALTDEDGWYQIYYKHTGKPTIFTVTITKDDYSETVTVTLKANSYHQIDFDVPQ